MKECCAKTLRFAKRKDLFQTTLIEKSNFGALISFIFFPIIVICYTILMYYTVFPTTQTKTELISDGNCRNISAMCISKYGCLVGEYKPESNKIDEDIMWGQKSHKDTNIKSYIHEETFTLNICPEINAFIDVATSYGCSEKVTIHGGDIGSTKMNKVFEVNNTVYFYNDVKFGIGSGLNMINYNLLSQKSRKAKLKQESSSIGIGSRTIINTYSTEKNSYAISASYLTPVKIYKMNINTGKFIGQGVVVSKNYCNQVTENYGFKGKYQLKNGTYIGLLTCAVVVNNTVRAQVNNTVSSTVIRINMNGDNEPFIVDKVLVTEGNKYCGFVQYNSSHGFLQTTKYTADTTKYTSGYSHWAIHYLIDLDAWEIISSSKRIINGQCLGTRFFDCGKHMFLYREESKSSEKYNLLVYDMLNNFQETISKQPFFSGLPSGGGCVITNEKVQAIFVSKGPSQKDQFVTKINNVNEKIVSVNSRLQLKGYYNHGGTTFLYNDERDDSTHLLIEVEKLYQPFASPEIIIKSQIVNINLNYALNDFPILGKPILKIGKQYDLPFPFVNDPSSTSSVFLSEFENVKKPKYMEKLTYLDAKVLPYENLPCTIQNKSGQCKRLNKHPASMKTIETFQYSFQAAVTLIFTTIISMYSALRLFVKYSLKCMNAFCGISNNVDKRSLSIKFLNGSFAGEMRKAERQNDNNKAAMKARKRKSSNIDDATTGLDNIEILKFDNLRNSRNSWANQESNNI